MPFLQLPATHTVAFYVYAPLPFTLPCYRLHIALPCSAPCSFLLCYLYPTLLPLGSLFGSYSLHALVRLVCSLAHYPSLWFYTRSPLLHLHPLYFPTPLAWTLPVSCHRFIPFTTLPLPGPVPRIVHLVHTYTHLAHVSYLRLTTRLLPFPCCRFPTLRFPYGLAWFCVALHLVCSYPFPCH